MRQVLYFYEGESEKKLITYLKDRQIIKPGRIKKFNLWQDKFTSIERTLPLRKRLKLYFIIDTDALKSVKWFKDNLKKLKKYNICLIVQSKNLEDELSYMCEQSKKQLFTAFDASNKEEFTSKFIKANLVGKLRNCNFNKLWSRGTNFLQKNNIENLKNCQYKL
ncbi:hypothetical protein BHECKSOX2_403 [Bathymodiolus heckerae thiotrophic gill symbiont]|uniref:hypothetical protein n=1 Tax=Bathymodiolus heckerae thiotrophic gill symbiont TaxID=1052212 RepID=UPI0010B20CBF|nr:hypothetical protein [Bathymodiolus heckerae thiotrophic gill symbiont]SMN13341.1 hypothetical protein BHECKSOX2_403 [Bathymodiolus heckerae thiotrophic gill symbiont]